MSETGDVPAAPWPPSGNGFTLIEMLVTLAIMALIAGIGFPALERGIDRHRAARATADAASLLAAARARAIRTGTSTGVTSLPGGHALSVGDNDLVLPDGLTATLDRALMFHPDGSASGATLLIRGKQFVRRFRIAASDGAIAAQ